MRFTYSGLFLGSMTLAAGFIACSGGGETTASTATGTAAATSSGAATTMGSGMGGAGGSSDAAATSTGAGTGGGASTASASSTGTGMAAVGYCTRPCGTVADCCPAGSMGCPSNMYPNNYTCDKSACKAPQCATTADCAAVDPAQECLVLPGFNACSATCKNDGECMAPATCSGVDANNKKYCFSSGGGCTDDASCGGLGKCVNKVCVCASAADCTKPGFTACAL